MDRRKFMNSLALVSAGALVLPSVDVFATSTGEIIKLQPTGRHVRHGLFNLLQNSQARRDVIKDWIKSMQRNQFFQNGYSHENGDPYVISVETSKGENLQIMLEGDSVNCYINSKKLRPNSNNNFKTQNLEIKVIELTSNSSQMLMLKGKKSFFVPIEGKVKVGTVTLMDEIGLVLDDKQSIEIKGTGTAKLLLISEI